MTVRHRQSNPAAAGRFVRVVCAAAVAGLSVLPARAVADDRVASKLSIYVDDDATEVYTTIVSAAKDVWEGGTLSARYSADVISSASVDVVSNASPAFFEVRNAASVGVAQVWESEESTNRTTLDVVYGFSHEPDYLGNGVSVAASRELASRNATLSADYGILFGNIGRSGDHRDRFASVITHTYGVGFSQVLSRSTVASVRYAGSAHVGHNSSPYLFARVGDASRLRCRACPQENHPDLRLRNAFVLSLKRHLWRETAVEGTYRFYLDNWAMLASDAEARLHFGLGTRWGVRLRYRFYHQTAASFFQAVYPRRQRYMTGDKELGELMSNLAGVKAHLRLTDWWVFDTLTFDAKIDLFQYNRPDFDARPLLRGIVAESGFEARF